MDHAIKDCPHLPNAVNQNQQQQGQQRQPVNQNQGRAPQQQQQQRQQVQNQQAKPPPNRNNQARPNQQQNRPNQQGRFYNINRADAEAVGDVIEGKLLVCGVEAQISFDPGPTHSFLSPLFAKKIDAPPRIMDYVLTVTTPVGKQVVCRTFYPRCPVQLGEVSLLANLILLDMHDFDVILGMDWLETYHATMDYFGKTITFRLQGPQAEFIFWGNRKKSGSGFISALKASRLVNSECE